jgi:hypothetical protein
MDTTLLIGIVVAFVVVFFGYQWWSAASRPRGRKAVAAPVPVATQIEQVASPITTAPPKEESYPVIAGQTEGELRAKEPVQRHVPASKQEPVTEEGHGPAEFESNLRRPEQSFHQPAPALVVSDVPSGRAAAQSSPMGGMQQPFSPEMAQNGGALGGGGMFAYDGMEPTSFSEF